jgi:hypothetical protein
MSVPSSTYEFSPSQNELVGNLAKKMRLVGLVTIVFGVLALLAGIVHAVGLVSNEAARTDMAIPMTVAMFLYAFVYLCFGVWTRQAGNGFYGIAATQGNDIGHLMNALANLRKIYTVMYALIIIALIAYAIMVVLVVIGLFAGK